MSAAVAPRRGRRGALAVPVDHAPRPPWRLAAPTPSLIPASADGDAGGARAASGPTARGARILSIGIARPASSRSPTSRVAGHVLDDDDYGRDLAAVVVAVRRHLGDLPAGRAAAVAHDRRPARARHHRRPPAAASRCSIQAAFALGVPGRRAGAARADRGRALRRRSRRCTGSSSARRWPTRRRYFARGYLAGHQWFGLYGGLVLFESLSRFCFPVAVAVGHRHGRDGGRAGHPRRAARVAAGRSRGRCGRHAAAGAAAAGGRATRGDDAASRRRLRALGRRDPARRADAAQRRRAARCARLRRPPASSSARC